MRHGCLATLADAVSDVSVTIGDVVHFVEPDAAKGVLDIPTESPAPSIAGLLQTSRDAHRRFRESDGFINRDGTLKTAPNYDIAHAEIQAALDARLAAQAADPAHTDPAWAEDQAANRGITSEALTDFYRDYLA